MYSLLLAEIAEQKTISASLRIGDSVVLQLDGFLFVVVSLGLTWAVITALGVYFKRAAIIAAASAAATAAAAQARAVAPVASPAPVAVNTPEPVVLPAASEPAPITDLPPELVAVIAAAVQLTLRDAYRIHAIIPVAGHEWAHEGRRQIFASHQVR